MTDNCKSSSVRYRTVNERQRRATGCTVCPGPRLTRSKRPSTSARCLNYVRQTSETLCTSNAPGSECRDTWCLDSRNSVGNTPHHACCDVSS